MKIRKDLTETLFDIKNKIPGFDREELLSYTKWAIPDLYYSLRDKQKVQIKCSKELTQKLNNEYKKYRIIPAIDSIAVQYAEILDCTKNENEFYIRVYASIYFYDNVKNNIGSIAYGDKYWNDIWIITYKESTKVIIKNSNCNNCGAPMNYNPIRDILKCEYCGNTIQGKFNANWEVVDIELDN